MDLGEDRTSWDNIIIIINEYKIKSLNFLLKIKKIFFHSTQS